jgi:hypothetical protein
VPSDTKIWFMNPIRLRTKNYCAGESQQQFSSQSALILSILSEVVPFETQKSTRSGSLFLSDGQYVGSPIDRCFKLLPSIVLCSLCPLGVMGLDP